MMTMIIVMVMVVVLVLIHFNSFLHLQLGFLRSFLKFSLELLL
jgi:hypothetical protein